MSVYGFRLVLVLLLFAVRAYSQGLEQLSPTVVLLQEREQTTVTKDGKPVTQTLTKVGTGFLVAHENTLFLVTAQHVASDMKSERTATIRADNDTPINMPIEDLVGDKNVKWVFHDKEDVRSLF